MKQKKLFVILILTKLTGMTYLVFACWKFVMNLCGPLGLICQSCFENGKFPSEWKKAKVVPTHKKNDKQLVKNYRPILLLPIFGKIFERLIYNKLFHFFQGNNLILPNQSGFNHALINYWLLLVKYINHLKMNMKWVESFSIFLKYLIKFGTKVLYIN